MIKLSLIEVIEHFPQYDIAVWNAGSQEEFRNAFERIYNEYAEHGVQIEKPVISSFKDEDGRTVLNLEDPFNRDFMDDDFHF